MNQAKGEYIHGESVFYKDKTTGTLLYNVQDAEGYETNTFISEAAPGILLDYDKHFTEESSDFRKTFAKVSGKLSDLVEYTPPTDEVKYSIKYAKRDISQITPKDYDHHAWAFVNNVLNPQDEYGRLMNAISDIKLKFKYPKTPYGDYMIPVAYENGVSKIVFTDGKHEYPSISMVAEIVGGSKFLEDLFNEQRNGNNISRILFNFITEKEGYIFIHTRKDFGSLREIQQNRTHQKTDGDSENLQNRLGDSRSNQETVKPSIPTKVESLSLTEMEKLSDEEFAELYDFFGIEDILATAKDTDDVSGWNKTC